MMPALPVLSGMPRDATHVRERESKAAAAVDAERKTVTPLCPDTFQNVFAAEVSAVPKSTMRSWAAVKPSATTHADAENKSPFTSFMPVSYHLT